MRVHFALLALATLLGVGAQETPHPTPSWDDHAADEHWDADQGKCEDWCHDVDGHGCNEPDYCGGCPACRDAHGEGSGPTPEPFVESPLCEKLRAGEVPIEEQCDAMKNAGWTCDSTWSKGPRRVCIGDNPDGAEYNTYSVRWYVLIGMDREDVPEGARCAEWCSAGGGDERGPVGMDLSGKKLDGRMEDLFQRETDEKGRERFPGKHKTSAQSDKKRAVAWLGLGLPLAAVGAVWPSYILGPASLGPLIR